MKPCHRGRKTVSSATNSPVTWSLTGTGARGRPRGCRGGSGSRLGVHESPVGRAAWPDIPANPGSRARGGSDWNRPGAPGVARAPPLRTRLASPHWEPRVPSASKISPVYPNLWEQFLVPKVRARQAKIGFHQPGQ